MAEESVAGNAAQRRKQRSPSYPGIGLEAALDRARDLYREIGRSPAHVEAALKALGYGPKSSGGRTIIAALKKFGLLNDEGSLDRRQVQLTPLALRIILDDRGESPERDEAIGTAALSPTIHRELLDRYNGSLPGDDTLRTYLRVDRAFTDRAVKEFVPQFKATVAFAKLGSSDTVSQTIEDKAEPVIPPDGRTSNKSMTPPATVNPPRSDTPPVTDLIAPLPVNVMFGSGEWATLQVSARLSDSDWLQLMAVLNAMKPGLTKPD
jgi:hypothetical protein